MKELINATIETIKMTGYTLLFAYAFGLPLAIITNETNKGGLYEHKIINLICNIVIGAGRSIPFAIMIIICLPVTRWLIGTGIGTTAVIVPLTIAAIPFVARIIESALSKVDYWVIVAAKIDGAKKIKIIFKIKIRSQLPELVNGVGITSVAIIGYTTMAGVVGGGGLGNYAITKGLYHYSWSSVLYPTLIITAMVILIQLVCGTIYKKMDCKKK